jgi:hypothetical protein
MHSGLLSSFTYAPCRSATARYCGSDWKGNVLKRMITPLVYATLICASSTTVAASGHGPVFGGATPTLGRGGWSLDEAWTGRFCSADQPSDQMFRTMLSYGATENVQVSFSVPVPVSTGTLPPARMMSIMSSTTELEGIIGWRFQRHDVGVGGRQESTAYVGGTAPLTHAVNHIALGPSLYVSAATGYASRAQYVWGSAGLQEYATREGERVGGSRFASVVYGYRPSFLRVEPPKPDLRFFVEASYEHRAATTPNVTSTGASNTLFAGPTFLLLYRAYGLSGGALFPTYTDVPAALPHERVRVAINASYFFWLH